MLSNIFASHGTFVLILVEYLKNIIINIKIKKMLSNYYIDGKKNNGLNSKIKDPGKIYKILHNKILGNELKYNLSWMGNQDSFGIDMKKVWSKMCTFLSHCKSIICIILISILQDSTYDIKNELLKPPP